MEVTQYSDPVSIYNTSSLSFATYVQWAARIILQSCVLLEIFLPDGSRSYISRLPLGISGPNHREVVEEHWNISFRGWMAEGDQS